MTEPSSSSPTLGFDLLGNIFHELAQLEYKHSPGHLESLLLVDREWRSCALAHSRIWSMFYITWQSDNPPGSVQRWRNRMNRFFQRSNTSTLTIFIEFTRLAETHVNDPTCQCSWSMDSWETPFDSECNNTLRYWGWVRGAVELLVGAEGEHMRRWVDLEICWDDTSLLIQMEPPLSQADLFQYMRYPAPALKRLALDRVDETFEGVLPAIPALQTLIMDQCKVDPLEGLSTSLKYFEYTFCPDFGNCSLLNLSTLLTLEHLRIEILSDPRDSHSFRKWLACTLPSLRVLELRAIPPSCINELVLPNLHSLILHVPLCFQSNTFHGPEVDPAELRVSLATIEVLSVHWSGSWHLGRETEERAEFIGGTLQKVFEMAIGLVEIRLDAGLYYGTRAMLQDKQHLLPELQRIMVFRAGVPVGVDGRDIAGRLGVGDWRTNPRLLPEGWGA